MFDLTPLFRGTGFAAYDPFREMQEFEKRFFGRQLPAFKTDIRETENAYILEADLPGFAKEDIRAEVKNGHLTITAEHKSEQNGEDGNYIRKERTYGSFVRSFDLEGINSDEISASYKDGVLSLTLPKEKERTELSRTISIS